MSERNGGYGNMWTIRRSSIMCQSIGTAKLKCLLSDRRCRIQRLATKTTKEQNAEPYLEPQVSSGQHIPTPVSSEWKGSRHGYTLSFHQWKWQALCPFVSWQAIPKARLFVVLTVAVLGLAP